MKALLLLLVCWLWPSFNLVRGLPPPFRPMAEVGDAARALIEGNHVSTELTLAASSSTIAPQSGRFGLLDRTVQPSSIEPSQMQDVSFSRSPVGFSHSHLSPFRRHPLLSEEQPLNQADSSSSRSTIPFTLLEPAIASEEPTTAALVENLSNRNQDQGGRHAVIRTETDLDAVFGDNLASPTHYGLWKLPNTLYYRPSRWFNALYEYVIQPSQYRKPWSHPVRMELSTPEVQVILSDVQKLFPIRAFFYKLSFEASSENGHQAGDVLIRYTYDAFAIEGVRIPETSLMVWMTSDRGSRLAFLGIFHCPRALFQRLKRRPNTQKLQVTRFLDTEGTFLIPSGPPDINAASLLS